eukprot:1634921-Rhodomonas_salina.2
MSAPSIADDVGTGHRVASRTTLRDVSTAHRVGTYQRTVDVLADFEPVSVGLEKNLVASYAASVPDTAYRARRQISLTRTSVSVIERPRHSPALVLGVKTEPRIKPRIKARAMLKSPYHLENTQVCVRLGPATPHPTPRTPSHHSITPAATGHVRNH